MVTAYNIGLLLGALTSAFVISRVLFRLARKRLRGWARATVANIVSFVLIVAVSIPVRHGLEWDAVALHLVAQAVWLGIDLIVEKPAA